VTGESDIAHAFVSNANPGLIIGLISQVVYKSGMTIYTFADFFSSITLATKTFDNVYATKTTSSLIPKYIVYINYEIGVVGFKESTSGQVWAFDRIE